MDPSRSSPRILSLKIQFACTASLFDVLNFGLTGEGQKRPSSVLIWVIR